MENIEQQLKGRTIVKATVDGFGVCLTLDDGNVFEYEASDGGYSLFEIHKAIESD